MKFVNGWVGLGIVGFCALAIASNSKASQGSCKAPEKVKTMQSQGDPCATPTPTPPPPAE